MHKQISAGSWKLIEAEFLAGVFTPSLFNSCKYFSFLGARNEPSKKDEPAA